MSPQRKVFRRSGTTAEKRRQSFHKGSLSCCDPYVVMTALRRIGLGGTELARATCGTIRLELLKIGALIPTSVRRVKIAFASSCPYQAIFAHAHRRLR
jgi:hypothetical protein